MIHQLASVQRIDGGRATHGGRLMESRLRGYTGSIAIAGVVALGFGAFGLVYADSAFAATTRFVASTGSDTVPANNPCTNAATPCKTITRALTVSVAGDTINVAA